MTFYVDVELSFKDLECKECERKRDEHSIESFSLPFLTSFFSFTFIRFGKSSCTSLYARVLVVLWRRRDKLHFYSIITPCFLPNTVHRMAHTDHIHNSNRRSFPSRVASYLRLLCLLTRDVWTSKIEDGTSEKKTKINCKHENERKKNNFLHQHTLSLKWQPAGLDND